MSAHSDDVIAATLADHAARISSLEVQIKSVNDKLDRIVNNQVDDVKKTNYTLVILLITVVGTLTNVILHFLP